MTRLPPLTLLPLLLLPLLATAAPGTAKARALNVQGYRHYRQHQDEAAISAFRQAIEADPGLAIAHYNLAATLGRARKERRICELDAYQRAVTDELEKSVQLDPGRRKRMQEDPDFDDVRDTLAYQRLLLADPDSPESRRQLLTHVTWYGPAKGAFGNAYGLTLRPDGSAEYWQLELKDDTPKRVSYRGRWRLVPGQSAAPSPLQLILELPKQGQAPAGAHPGTFDGTTLRFDGGKLELTDQKSECEA